MRTRLKYFSYDKIPYLYDSMEGEEFPYEASLLLDPDLKIAG